MADPAVILHGQAALVHQVVPDGGRGQDGVGQVLQDRHTVLQAREGILRGLEDPQRSSVRQRIVGQVDGQILGPRHRVVEVQEDVHRVLLVEGPVLHLLGLVLPEERLEEPDVDLGEELGVLLGGQGRAQVLQLEGGEADYGVELAENLEMGGREGGRVKRSGAAVGGKDSSLLRPNMCGGRLNIRRCNEEGQRGNDSLLMNRDIEAPRR